MNKLFHKLVAVASMALMSSGASAALPAEIGTALAAFLVDGLALIALVTPVAIGIAVGFKVVGLAKRGVRAS